ncbi:NAD-dependent epimerase/dehydratase family protein [Shewanella surugensis]|uniref:NAD-dependent epimerase/dehydratase family protein n=1 Tax=Shewanella surugensis TaxID=212020 RepID=A0ABT0LIH9_9GAMM|nr:NAD-dependent epimerase/dehydratase family protein [Shewanella surugensis]MCL1127508.1 NAD-dependent epimerase/dehydratase family protein [Shewanella surugensis]
MNILLTGSSGFIGSFFTSNYPIKRHVVRSSDKVRYASEHSIANLDESANWSDAFVDIDTVIHLAGLAHDHSFTEEDYQAVNVSGTLHLAREATNAGVKRFVFVSSIGVNGTITTETPFSNNSVPNPHNAYSQSKYDAEVGLNNLAKDTGIEVVIVRPTLVYGPDAPGNFGALTQLIHKFPFLPFALVNNKRNFISVQNLCDLLFTCASHPKAPGNIFLASDCESVSIKEFSNAIAVGLGGPLIQLPVPVGLMKFLGKLFNKPTMVQQLVGNLEVDSSNLQHVLGWSAPYTMKQAMSFLSGSK